MGTSLTGKQIKNTYKSLIKTSDSTEASATAKLLSDGNGNDFGVYIDTDGVFGIGSAPSYSLDVSSRTDGVALPVGTTANRPTPTNGLLRYNSTIGKIEFYDGGWKTVFTTSGGTIDGSLIVTGDLTIQGTTVTLNTETVQFEDNILLLNRASADTQYDATNAGIEIEKTSATNPSFLYTYSTSTWGLTDNLTVEGDLTVDTNTLYVDSADNRVGIGTASPNAELEIHGNLNIGDGTSVVSIGLQRNSANYITATDAAGYLVFRTGGANERMRIDSSGNVLINNSSNRIGERLNVTGSGILIEQTDGGIATMLGAFGSSDVILGAFSNNDVQLRTNNTERMRITNGGDLYIGTGASVASSTQGGASFVVDTNDRRTLLLSTQTTSANSLVIFYNTNGVVGTISTSGSSTAYNTTSDYRLKENVVPMEGALDRVDALKPSRFNFIANADKTVDGFLAHEVAEVVPEAISGEKDAVEEYEVTPAVLDDEGNVIEEAVMGTRPVYQGIDQSKLVPLLTAALQEAHTLIKDLTARIETLENQ